MESSTQQRRLEAHRDEAMRRELYSVQRSDLLIVAVCGGGLYICFETLKFMMAEHIELPSTWLKYAGAAFMLGIIANFISQLHGQRTNRAESSWAMHKLRRMDKGLEAEVVQELDMAIGRLDEQVATGSKRTRYYSQASIVAMLLGVLLLLLFFLMYA